MTDKKQHLVIDHDKARLALVCPECRVGLLKPHPQADQKVFRDTLKCGTCGFAKIAPTRRK